MPSFVTARWFVVATAMAPVVQKVMAPATTPLRDAYLHQRRHVSASSKRPECVRRAEQSMAELNGTRMFWGGDRTHCRAALCNRLFPADAD
jgi:hypothetical protein